MVKGAAVLGRKYGVRRKVIHELGVEQFLRSTDLARRILINEYMRRKKP
jgi:hypothetical protein